MLMTWKIPTCLVVGLGKILVCIFYRIEGTTLLLLLFHFILLSQTADGQMDGCVGTMFDFNNSLHGKDPDEELNEEPNQELYGQRGGK